MISGKTRWRNVLRRNLEVEEKGTNYAHGKEVKGGDWKKKKEKHGKIILEKPIVSRVG